MLCIQQAISKVSRKKALRIKHGLLEKDFKAVNQSMEEDIKVMSDKIEKRLIQNPNLVITNTRFIDL